MTLRAALTSLLCLLSAAAVPAEVQTWHIVADEEGTQLSFHSKATLESFDGETGNLTGTIVLDPADLGTLTAEVTADLASMDTGIGLRNKHMRNNVLHTDDYPTAVFVLEECDGDALVPGQELTTAVVGHMTLHGVEQRMEAATTVRMDGDGTLRIEATFEIKLADYGIKRPKMLMMKVAEQVSVTVRALARPGPGPAPTPN